MEVFSVKQIIYSLLCLTVITATVSSYATPAQVEKNQKIEFAWDMHGVLIKKNMPRLIKATVVHGAGKAVKLIGRLGYDYTHYLFTGKKGKSQLLVDELKTLGAGGAGGSAYAYALDKYEPGWGTVVSSIVREHTPIKGMAELIQELSDLGYTHRIATNEGFQLYQEQKDQYPELFKNIEWGSTVEYEPGIPVIKKPALNYFRRHHCRFNRENEKTIIFIDDKQENVDVANKAGMIGIRFTTPQKLRSDLIAHGIPLERYRILRWR